MKENQEKTKKVRKQIDNMSNTNITVNGIVSMLLHNDNFLFFLHENPDADAIGSNLAIVNTLKILGKNAYIVSSDPIPSSLLFLTDRERNFSLDEVPSNFKPDLICSCDVASPSQLGKYRDMANSFDLAIDHHEIHEPFAKYRLVDSNAAAAAEIVYKVISKLTPHIPISKDIASLLYAALAADTGGFRYSNTTPETHKIAAKLIERGADHTEICRNLFEMKSISALRAEAFASSHTTFYYGGKISYIKITDKDRKENGFSSEDEYDVINVIRRVDGVKIAIFAREKDDGNYKISTRSSCQVNVADLCALYGGGGHFGAAGCTVSKEIVDSAVDRIMKECNFEQ